MTQNVGLHSPLLCLAFSICYVQNLWEPYRLLLEDQEVWILVYHTVAYMCNATMNFPLWVHLGALKDVEEHWCRAERCVSFCHLEMNLKLYFSPSSATTSFQPHSSSSSSSASNRSPMYPLPTCLCSLFFCFSMGKGFLLCRMMKETFKFGNYLPDVVAFCLAVGLSLLWCIQPPLCSKSPAQHMLCWPVWISSLASMVVWPPLSWNSSPTT